MYIAPKTVEMVHVSPQQQPYVVKPVQSFFRHIIFSCLVLWLCNPLFGLIAFILAGTVINVNEAVSYRKQIARQHS